MDFSFNVTDVSTPEDAKAPSSPTKAAPAFLAPTGPVTGRPAGLKPPVDFLVGRTVAEGEKREGKAEGEAIFNTTPKVTFNRPG